MTQTEPLRESLGDGGRRHHQPVLEAEHLGLSIRGKDRLLKVVDDVSFSIRRGELLGLIGESGSGKTMIARSILRLGAGGQVEAKGALRVEGANVLTLRAEPLRRLRRDRVGMISQEPTTSLNPLMKAGTQIVETMRKGRSGSRRARRTRALELLADVRFEHPEQISAMYPHELSGGMRQRILIAMALANSPGLLIADEPTTALDVTVQAEVLDIIQDLRHRQQLAVLFISHDLTLVYRYASRIAVLYGGVLMELGTAEQIVRSPRHPYTAALLACSPRRREGGRLQPSIDGTVPSVASWLPGCRFAQRCPQARPRCHQDPVELLERPDGSMVRCLFPLN